MDIVHAAHAQGDGVTHITPTKVFGHLDRLAGWQRGDRPAPVTVEIDLSNTCSLGCQSCHFAHTHVAGPWAKDAIKPKDYSDTGRFADPSVLIPALADMKAAGVEAIVWSGGGEPTLHPEFDAIVKWAHTCGLQQGLYTLGGHLSEERAALVGTLFTWVVVSLDAPDADTYAKEKRVPTSRFFDACAGIHRLAKYRAIVGASFLLHADNWFRVPDMLSLARSLGASYTTFRPTIDTVPGDLSTLAGDRSWVSGAVPLLRRLASEPDIEVDPDRFEEYRDWTGRTYDTCYGVRLVTQITPDGRVWICPNRRGIAGSELGNLTTEGFADIWARHPGRWTDFAGCRAMCRLHLVNHVLATVHAPRLHEAFV